MSFYRIRPRAGTATQWNLVNPVLGEREIGIEVPETGVGTGLVKIKFGDGVTAWNDLPYGVLNPDGYIVQNLDTEAADKVPSAAAVKAAIEEVKSVLDETNNNLSNKTGIEQYNFDVSSDVTYDEYTVQNTGWATIYYQFATTQYSQFGLTINGQNIFASNKNISSGNNADGLTGALPLYLQKGDVVKVAYYSTFRMSIIGLRLRY